MASRNSTAQHPWLARWIGARLAWAALLALCGATLGMPSSVPVYG